MYQKLKEYYNNQGQILRRLLEEEMIIKLVCGKEIHVYDLKAHESLNYLVGKIRELFKKLPDAFVLVYKPVEQQEVRLRTNEQLDRLIDSVKSEVKMLKLFIEESGSLTLAQTKSQQKLQTQAIESFKDMTQKVECLQQQVDPNSQLEPKSSSSNQQIKPLCLEGSSESINSPTEVTTNEVQNFQNEFKYVDKPLDEREEPSQREINVNDGESSDPKELRNSSSNSLKTGKQNLINLGLTENLLRSHQPEQKPMLQKQSFEQQVEQPIADELIEDDFLSHNARCDICNIYPICGSRFKCVVCQSYDLCQICEQKHGHDHPVLKIRFSFQTPINIKVDIPEYRQHPIPEAKAVSQMVNLQKLSPKERRDRVQSVSSEISELLNRDIQECMDFVKRNEEYTKEVLIQALIENKEPSQLIKGEGKEEKQWGLKGIFSNVKGLIFGSK